MKVKSIVLEGILQVNNMTKSKISNSKKAASEMWWILAVAIIAFLIVVLILIWFRSSGERAFGEVGSKISGLGDCDDDKTANMFDKCAYDAKYTEPPKGGTCSETGKENCAKCGKLIC